MKAYKRRFIEEALDHGALKFGDFTLNSGRKSPYFYNSAVFCSGKGASALGSYLADALVDSNVKYNALLGSAYKGIPMVSALSMALLRDHNVNVDFFFNRKEEKDHGEGGIFCGPGSLNEREVVIVDDVLTSGKAVLQICNMVRTRTTAKIACVLLSFNRGERGLDTTQTALGKLETELGIPIISVVDINDVVSCLHGLPDRESEVEELKYHISNWG